MAAFTAARILLAIPCSSFGQGTVPAQVDIYFTIAPIYRSAGFTSYQANFIATIQNANHPLVPLIYPGAVISATNLFSFYPGNIGNELLTGVQTMSEKEPRGVFGSMSAK